MKRIFLITGTAIFAVLFLFSGVMVYRHYAAEQESKEAFESVSALLNTEITEQTGETGQTEPSEMLPGTDEPETAPQPTPYDKYGAVYEQNSDFIGWISIEGTNIDYPVMQTPDNPDFYLKHGFDKNYSDYGVPYVQEECDIDTSDNLIIYGHNMKNGSMFADLNQYKNRDFYEQHKTIRFDTLSAFGEYEIIAVFKTVATAVEGFKYYHFIDAEDEAAFDAYIAGCKELSLYDTGVSAKYGDRLITLSTCEYSRTNGRMVIVAKLILPPDGEVVSDG